MASIVPEIYFRKFRLFHLRLKFDGVVRMSVDKETETVDDDDS